MKTKVLIVAFLIVSLICAFAFTSHAQKSTIYNTDGQFTKITTYSCSGKITDSTILIGDETWIAYTKTGARILTYSESVFKDISLKFGEEFKRISILYKKDRNGPYKEYVIYMSQEVGNNIKEWAKSNL